MRSIYKFFCLTVILLMACQTRDESNGFSAHQVTFHVIPKSLPDSATVYITGNNTLLGNGNPAWVPMNRNPDGSWSKTLLFPSRLIVEYKFDLGSPLSEAVNADSIPLGGRFFTVEKDTQIVVEVANWKDAILSAEEKSSPNYLAEKYFQRAFYSYAHDTESNIPDSALYYYEKAAELFQQTANWQRLVSCYRRMGGESLPLTNERIQNYNMALALSLSKLGENHPETASSYATLSDYYGHFGDYDLALEYANRALTIRINAYGETHLRVYGCYTLIGEIYGHRGDFDKAVENYEKALAMEIKVKGPTHQEIGNVYKTLGKINSKKGNLDKAIEYFEKAKRIHAYYYDEISVTSHMTYEELGEVYLRAGDYKRAEEHFQKSLAVRKKMYNQYHGHIAHAQIMLAEVNHKQQEYDHALVHVQRALQILVPSFVNSDIRVNPSIEGLTGYFALQKTLKQKGEILQDMANAHQSLGSKAKRNLETALNCYDIVLQLSNKTIGGFLSENSKLFLEEELISVVEQAIQAALKLHELTSDVVYKEKAWFFCEYVKSALLRLSVQESEAKTFAGIDDDIRQEEREMKEALVSLETLLAKERRQKERDETKVGELQTKYFGLKSQHEFLLTGLEEKYPRYFELKYQVPVATSSELQRRLDEKTALLEYFIGESTIYIFVITTEEFEIISVPKGENFTTMLMTYVNAIRRVVDQREYLESSLQLYNLLIQPVLTQIASKERLVIIPDGLLYYLPFEALLTKNAKRDKVDFTSLDYLIRRFEISYHYSATLYQKILDGQGESQLDHLLAFAPVFSKKNNNGTILAGNADVFADLAESEKLAIVTRDGSQFQELKHSESEVQTIVKLFEDRDKGSIAYLHDQASEENFKANAGKFRYLHVSTHGFMNDKNPRLSGLAFSQPVDSTAVEDGILYSAEVFNLELNADLVVLSSCESGIGKLAKGEGMLSMTRGFLYSGARNVMVSLWKVFDEHTSKLMIEFYRGVVTGENYAGALRKAKLKMLENPETALPASWASFVLVGE